MDLFLEREWPVLKQRLQRAALFIGSLAFFVAILDFALRLSLPSGYFVWPPNFRETFLIDPAVLRGVNAVATMTINAQGMRGDPLDGEERYRLLAIGGSTTMCTYLGDDEAWPLLVQRRLEAELGKGTVWIGNVGRPGFATPQHRLHAEKLLKQYPEIDAVLVLVGINDFLVRLSLLRDPLPLPQRGSNEAIRESFSVFPGWDPDSPWYRRTGIARWLAARRLPGQRQAGPLVDQRAAFVKHARDYRRQAKSFIDELPGLPDGLAIYEQGLGEIVDAVRGAGDRLIFLTQPTLWREGLTAEDEQVLWMGGPRFDRLASGAEFYSERALAGGMARYNETLLRVCRERGVECIDLASQLPRDGVLFSDDAHYSIKGSHRVKQPRWQDDGDWTQTFRLD